MHAQEDHALKPRPEDAHRAEDQREQGHGDDTTEETRAHDPLDGVHGHHLHGRKLVGRPHQADLRRQGRARTSGEQQGRDHRAEFPGQRQGRDHAQGLLRAEAREGVVSLQRKDHAHEEAREHDDHQ